MAGVFSVFLYFKEDLLTFWFCGKMRLLVNSLRHNSDLFYPIISYHRCVFGIFVFLNFHGILATIFMNNTKTMTKCQGSSCLYVISVVALNPMGWTLTGISGIKWYRYQHFKRYHGHSAHPENVPPIATLTYYSSSALESTDMELGAELHRYNCFLRKIQEIEIVERKLELVCNRQRN